MYKLIIIDDEYSSAQYMAEFINYEEFNFSVAGVFGSAENALEFLENNEVDLVLTDIKMRRMSGTELLKTINEKYPDILVVLVSAYRSFAYAKEAITNNAFEYITKPVSYAEFTRVLKKVLEVLDAKDEIKIANIEEIDDMQREICEFFGGRKNADEICKYLKTYNPEYDINNCRCSLLNINITGIADFLLSKWKHGSDKLFHAIRQIVPMKIENVYFLFLTETLSDIKIVSIDIKRSLDYEEIIDRFISNVISEISAILELDVEVIKLNSARSLNELYRTDISFIQHTVNAVAECMYKEEKEKAFSLVNHFFETKGITEHKTFCRNLSDKLREGGLLTEDLYLDPIQIQCIDNSKVLLDYCAVMIDNDLNSSELNCGVMIRTILYIDKHIGEDISQVRIAKYLKFNSSYFSHYFKREMGVRFSDYVLKFRMEKAKDMLINSPQLRINTIVSLLGYKSQPYFYKAFHDYTGHSPNDFKNKE